MIQIHFKPTFLRQFNALDQDLQSEVLDKIKLFKNKKNHKQLKVHKLKGLLNGRYSFSVNYQTRIVFLYEEKNELVLLAVGNHDVYKK